MYGKEMGGLKAALIIPNCYDELGELGEFISLVQTQAS
jgi:hypothetical protein